MTEVDQAPQVLHSGVTIGTGRPWRGEGSWSVRGLQQSNAAFRTFRSALFLYRWAVGGDLSPATEAALARGLTGRGSAESLSRQAAAFLRALLGDTDLRQWSVAAFADLAPEDRAHVDLAAAFRGMDRRLAAAGPAQRAPRVASLRLPATP